MTHRRAWIIGCLAVVYAGGCGKASPTAPTPSASVPSRPPILLVGQSNAYFLLPYLPEAIGLTDLDGSVDLWLNSREFAERARTPGLLALVWAQGARDKFMPGDVYADKLRAVIVIARSVHRELPVRIVETPVTEDRAVLREAQRQVSTDPGVQLIPTADLEIDAATGHLTAQGYQTVRDRIYRSLGQ